MKAWIDEKQRAIVQIQVGKHAKGPRQAINAWIDTAFDGHLVMPKFEIEKLGLGVLADTEAVLADGSIAKMRCYYCVVEWMSQTIPIQVIENAGQVPLIGTGLLATVDLRINYRTGDCTLS